MYKLVIRVVIKSFKIGKKHKYNKRGIAVIL